MPNILLLAANHYMMSLRCTKGVECVTTKQLYGVLWAGMFVSSQVHDTEVGVSSSAPGCSFYCSLNCCFETPCCFIYHAGHAGAEGFELPCKLQLQDPQVRAWGLMEFLTQLMCDIRIVDMHGMQLFEGILALLIPLGTASRTAET